MAKQPYPFIEEVQNLNNKRIAICPGSFDPITVGHLDIIRRAAGMFDEVVVAVLQNNKKTYTFSVEDRVDMIRLSISGMDNVSVESSSGLLADYAAEKGACAIVKGLRAMSDFEYEFQMALTNKKLNPNVETVFLTTSAENMYLSSSVVRQVASLGGDFKEFVPDAIYEKIREYLRKR